MPATFQFVNESPTLESVDTPYTRKAFPIQPSFFRALTTTYVPRRLGGAAPNLKNHKVGGEFAARVPKKIERALALQLLFAAGITPAGQTCFHVPADVIVRFLQPQGLDLDHSKSRAIEIDDIKKAITSLRACEFNFLTDHDHDGGEPIVPQWRSQLFEPFSNESVPGIELYGKKNPTISFRFDHRVIAAWTHATRKLVCDVDVLARFTQSATLALYTEIQTLRLVSPSAAFEMELGMLESLFDPGKNQRADRRGKPLKRVDNFVLRFVDPAVREINYVRPWGDRMLRMTKVMDGRSIVGFKFELTTNKMVAARIKRKKKAPFDLFDRAES